jgi:hypothetical protein
MGSFQIKDFASISASLINMMQATQTKVTDFNIGSVVRTMLESVAVEIDELYQQMLNGLLQSIPVAVYNSFTFPALAPLPASGVINVNVAAQPNATLIAAGTVFTAQSNSNTYATGADITMMTGTTSVLVPVTSTVAGSASNLGALTSFAMSPQPTGFVSAANPNAWINGQDAETAAEQLLRFNGFISTLARGTQNAVAYGAKTSAITDPAGNIIEQVVSAIVLEPYLTNTTLSPSLYYCFIHNGVGGTSQGLVAQTQAVVNGYTLPDGVTLVPGWKAAGTVCTVLAATEQPVNVTATLFASPGYNKATLVTAAVSVLTAYLVAIPTGGAALFALLESLVMAIPGVANFIIATPTVDTQPTATNFKLMPGVITVS